MTSLDHRACVEANESLWRLHPELKGRQLTMSANDSAYRAEWRRQYNIAAARTPLPPAPRLEPVADVALPPTSITGPTTKCGVESMTHEQKMAEAISRSSIWPALKDEIDLLVLVEMMLATMIGMALLAATGIGGLAEGVGAGLLVIGGLLSGYQIGGGLMDLYDFFDMTRCDRARTEADLDAAGKKFASGVAKTGVGGLFLLLGFKGAKGRTWRGKPIAPLEPLKNQPVVRTNPTPAELNAKYGELKEPIRIKGFEKTETGATKKNPTLQVVQEGKPPTLDPAKGKDPGYIWLIDEEGNMRIAEQVKVGQEPDGWPQKLGHPTLVEGEDARIGGELRPKEGGGWTMDNQSGRYSRHADRGAEQLENAAQILRDLGIDVTTNFATQK